MGQRVAAVLAGRRARVAVSAGLVLLAVTAYALTAGSPGRASTLYTRADLERPWPGADPFPLVVPATIPTGVDPDEEPGFILALTGDDPADSSSRRTRITYYDGSAWGLSRSVDVFQRPSGAKPGRPCGARERLHITRRTATAVLTICSDDLDRPRVRRYWQHVRLTSDLDEASWIPR